MTDPDNLSDGPMIRPSALTPGGILDGWSPAGWSLKNSSLNTILDPEAIASIDFSGERDGGESRAAIQNAQGVPGWAPGSGGFFTELTPYDPNASWRYPNQDIAGKSRAPSPDQHAVTENWSQLPRPTDLESGESGSGYYTYGTDKSGKSGTTANAQWGTPRAMQVIGAVADTLSTGDQYTPFGVGNISLQGGADFSGRNGHKGHRDGLGIDVRPARSDGVPSRVTYKDPAYDRAATQRLVDAFRATGQVKNIYFNDPQIRGVLPSSQHDDHLHIQLGP